jgi:hypothetical protein
MSSSWSPPLREEITPPNLPSKGRQGGVNGNISQTMGEVWVPEAPFPCRNTPDYPRLLSYIIFPYHKPDSDISYQADS